MTARQVSKLGRSRRLQCECQGLGSRNQCVKLHHYLIINLSRLRSSRKVKQELGSTGARVYYTQRHQFDLWVVMLRWSLVWTKLSVDCNTFDFFIGYDYSLNNLKVWGVTHRTCFSTAHWGKKCLYKFLRLEKREQWISYNITMRLAPTNKFLFGLVGQTMFR